MSQVRRVADRRLCIPGLGIGWRNYRKDPHNRRLEVEMDATWKSTGECSLKHVLLLDVIAASPRSSYWSSQCAPKLGTNWCPGKGAGAAYCSLLLPGIGARWHTTDTALAFHQRISFLGCSGSCSLRMTVAMIDGRLCLGSPVDCGLIALSGMDYRIFCILAASLSAAAAWKCFLKACLQSYFAEEAGSSLGCASTVSFAIPESILLAWWQCLYITQSDDPRSFSLSNDSTPGSSFSFDSSPISIIAFSTSLLTMTGSNCLESHELLAGSHHGNSFSAELVALAIYAASFL